MSIPPLLSSTPPPLEENGSVLDHDDDFGEFSDHASVGAVSSATSITDGSSVFRPIETVEPSGGLHLCDTSLKPDSLQEVDEWSQFDSAIVRPSYEPMHTDAVDTFRDQTLVVDHSVSDITCAADPPVCMSYAGGTGEGLEEPPSPSQMISEQLNSGDVSLGRYSSEEADCDADNSQCEGDVVDKLDHDLCENVSTVSGDAKPQCEVEEMKQSVDEDEVSLSAADNDEVEFQSTVDHVLQGDDSENCNNFHVSSTADTSVRSETGFASDEKDFMDDFQSLSDDKGTHEEVEPNISNIDSLAFISHEEHEASLSNETSVVYRLSSTDSPSEDTLCKDDFSSVLNISTIHAADSVSIHQSTEQVVVSNEEADDDFDDFEEYVAANEGPTDCPSVVESSAYHWGAFENTDAGDDDWAAFQDSDQPALTGLTSDISDDIVSSFRQPVVAYSNRLSKVCNFGITVEI